MSDCRNAPEADHDHRATGPLHRVIRDEQIVDAQQHITATRGRDREHAQKPAVRGKIGRFRHDPNIRFGQGPRRHDIEIFAAAPDAR